MKALSLMQPMAWAMFHGKNCENRDRRFSHRGLLIIHASKNFNPDHLDFLQRNPDIMTDKLPDYFLQGFLLGVVTITNCVVKYDSPWFFGPHALLSENAREFRHPIPYRGWPGLFEVPNEVIESEI